MSVPEKPYTRKEAYLNAAATGDTSGIPETPYTREEMYLDAIAKNGGGGGGGSSTLSGLTDVDISNPTNGQTLVYNATSGKWENGNGGGGGASLIMPNVSITVTGKDTATATCDLTRAAIVSAIENGAICNAKIACNAWGSGSFQFASQVIVVAGEEGYNPDMVVFSAYVLMGDGDIEWYTVTVYDDRVECFIDHTHSYTP